MMRTPVAIALCAVLAACGGGRDAPGGIEATRRAPVEGPGRCGIPAAYSVTEVAGVRLSRPATLTLATAEALETWVRRVVVPEVGNRGGGLESLTVAASYACRTRNSRPDTRISEHALGRAIDISGFVFADGTRMTVEDGWRGDRRDRKLLRALHRGACGPFGTVLGPESDRYHQDHFHLDIARYRSGPYCR